MESLTNLEVQEKQAYIELTKQCCSTYNQQLLLPFLKN